MKKVISMLLVCLMCVSMSATLFAAEMNFVDVPEGEWYYNDVKYAVEMGLINGKTEDTFCPEDMLTYAETVKLAACMNQLYNEGMVNFESRSPWYRPYVDYCMGMGIISQEYSWQTNVTRKDYVVIFAKALPDEAFKEINNVPDDSIPDVKIRYPYAEAVYKMYRAGILTGSGEEHRFNPGEKIKRCEVAAILARMMDESRRVTFEMPVAETTTETSGDILEGETQTTTETSGDILEGETQVTTETAPDVVSGETTDVEWVVNNYVTIEEEKTDDVVVNTVVEDVEYVMLVGMEIKTQPKDYAVSSVPARAKFTVEAQYGTGTYTYQWEAYDPENRSRGWIKLVEPDSRAIKAGTAKWIGSNTESLTVLLTEENLASLVKTKFRCVVTDGTGKTVTSDGAGFTVLTNKQIKELDITEKNILDIKR